MDIQSDLYQEISDQFESLRNYEKGSEQYGRIAESTYKLLDRAIEMNKFDAELEQKISQDEFEKDLKIKKAKLELVDTIVGWVIALGGLVVPAALAVWGSVNSWEFEKTGTICSQIGKLWVGKLIPRK